MHLALRWVALNRLPLDVALRPAGRVLGRPRGLPSATILLLWVVKRMQPAKLRSLCHTRTIRHSEYSPVPDPHTAGRNVTAIQSPARRVSDDTMPVQPNT